MKSRHLDGVICGHIHAAAIKDIEGVTYINCGDWVDSCTAIVEHLDGRLELVEWSETISGDAGADDLSAVPVPNVLAASAQAQVDVDGERVLH